VKPPVDASQVCRTGIDRVNAPTAAGEGAAIVNVVVSSRHMEVSPALKEYAEQKAQKLTRYYDRIQEIEVILDVVDRNRHTVSVEMIVNGEKKNLFIARHEGDDANGCIDHCVKTLERQLSDHHKLVKNRKHPEA
jgi:putative sigma-54 modulation protein